MWRAKDDEKYIEVELMIRGGINGGRWEQRAAGIGDKLVGIEGWGNRGQAVSYFSERAHLHLARL
jgi:hypothetical protein